MALKFFTLVPCCLDAPFPRSFMKLHEYQAKAILSDYGVPIPKGGVAETPAEVETIVQGLGTRVVVKAQIHAGGRGKGGGVKLADSPAQAAEVGSQILGMTLITPQTGPEGRLVRKVLVEEALDIVRELYLGVTVDREKSCAVMIASEAGGVDIEEVAAHTPEKILKEWVDPLLGLRPFQARRLAYALRLEPDQQSQAVRLMQGLYGAFLEKDGSLAEVNPLVVTGSGALLALDAKMDLDDNGLFRHPELQGLRDVGEENPFEVEASKYHLNYIKLDGNVSCIVNGAGLAMATMDIVKLAGAEPANFLDVGGGANAEMVENAFRILLMDPNVRAVFINIFGGILRCDVFAQGVVQAVKNVQVQLP
ncbi:MAG TPA: ADP-forming succinate--CoA ligase subunit beta, partial [Candidatus Tectomicrobia bacterium]|nr:ADP-forming succinate--CoA ligase subunit beta [Candidatus Tectomicrobia bacterium]